MKRETSFATKLDAVPTSPFRATLVRRVALSPLISSGLVDFLFTSGRPNRFNPSGVRCVYFAGNEATAAAEYERHTRPLQQPFATFYAEVSLARVLDLGSTAIRKCLVVTLAGIQANWIRSATLTVTQRLGNAVSQQSRIAAIRFPSEAMRMTGKSGFNVVIFRDCLNAPDFVRIIGPTRKAIQEWP